MVEQLIKTLNAGGIAVMPTDTMYGLVARALDKTAVERVYLVKNRSPKKPCIVLLSSRDDLAKLGVVLEGRTAEIINALWPGPVSMILNIDAPGFEYLHRGLGTLAFRLPANERLQRILAATGPLIAPSANPESFPPATTIEAAQRYFHDAVDYYEDGGVRENVPSTLIAIEHGTVRIVRQGSAQIPKEFL